MTQIIDVPGMGEVEFPDDMSDAQITAAIKKNIQPAMPSPGPWSPARLPRSMDEAKSYALNLARGNVRNVGLMGRTILNTVTGIPLAAMDAGVGVRNYIDEKMRPKQLSDLIAPKPFQGYELPSQTWNRALDEYGVPKPQGGVEKAADIVGQMAFGQLMPAPTQLGDLKSAAAVVPGVRATPLPQQLAPANFNPANARQLAFEKAREQGYAVPPSTVKPTITNKILEGAAGKKMLEQETSLRNQPFTDALVKQDLSMSAADQVAENTLPALRQAAAGPYKALRSIGTMRADADYGKALDAITAKYTGAAKDFPDLARSDVLNTVEAVRKPSFDSDSAMDAIAILRDKSSTAYAQGDKALGKAYKEISGAMEDAIERSLARRGKDSASLLSAFRDARQMIAKTYSAEGALNQATGNFSATKLATQLAKGKPLSGGMKKAAEFATAFPQAAKVVLDSGSVRNTDVALAAGTALLSKEPNVLLYPFARQAMRSALLSDAGQRALTQQFMPQMPRTALGILYGTQGLLSQ